jgi:uncharacterized membrane protein
MQTLGRGALEPLLIGIAIVISAVHGFDVGYEELGKAFLAIGVMLIGAAALYYFDIKSRYSSERQPAALTEAFDPQTVQR